MKKFTSLLLTVCLVLMLLLCGCEKNVSKTFQYENLGAQLSFKCKESWHIKDDSKVIFLSESGEAFKENRWSCAISTAKAPKNFTSAEDYVKNMFTTKSDYYVKAYNKKLSFAVYEVKNSDGKLEERYVSVYYDKDTNVMVIARFVPSEIKRGSAIKISKSISVEKLQ